MSSQEQVKVKSNQEITTGYYKLTFHSNNYSHCLPGQFLQIKCGSDYYPLLKKPFGIHGIKADKKEVEILYKVVGPGTQMLSKKKKDDLITIIGPLGNGFDIKKPKSVAVIMAGGIGIAPLCLLAQKLKKKVKTIIAIIGFDTKKNILCEKALKSIADKVYITTEDGSAGEKGMTTNLLPKVLSPNFNYQNAQVFACGPKAMLKEISEYTNTENIDCQLLLEEYMACGVGACFGCVIKTKSGYQKVCKDGPVFMSQEIIWE